MKKLQSVKIDKQLTKQEQIIEYLKQDSGYWLENDKWDMTKELFFGKLIQGCRYINFSNFKNQYLKNELKFYFLKSFKDELLSPIYISKLARTFVHFSSFLNLFYLKQKSFKILEMDCFSRKWYFYLSDLGFEIKNNQSTSMEKNSILSVIGFIKDFYDDREEVEKDIWNIRNIEGARIPASHYGNKSMRLDFVPISKYYRETVKSYFKTIITKRSLSHCEKNLVRIKYFFDYFYSNGYTDGFLEELSRNDIENYLFQVNNEYKEHNATYKSKFISFVRTFLEYIQMAQYEKAPKKEVSFLIFQDDIPKSELNKDEVKKAKFIPEPVIHQLDNNIMDLDRPKYIPIYILLRETGWRGTDILNLRYHNCLEKVWNKKEERYTYNLCGEITKTGIKELKIPIRDKVAEMVEDCIEKAKEKSTENNNPKKYLFNTFEGKRKGKPLSKPPFVNSIRRLIKEKDIRDGNGELYHFTLHQLRHTRAKEYVEQGMGISIIQQILGHTSLQMTVHYAKVTENKLYEKWKDTEDLELFKVNPKTNEVEEINRDSKDRENLIRYEYVKKNLDAVRVPFGVCFKPSKLPCKQQLNHCLTCASFCTTTENIPEYEEEIKRVKQQIKTSERLGRELWAEKNKSYLKLLEEMLEKVKTQKLVHKNAKSREVKSNG